MYSKTDVAKVIDHAVLKPTATDDDVRLNAKMCIERSVGDLCVRPTDVKLAVAELADSETTVAMVVGFPHGSNRSEVKALEAELAIKDGADELDMVMNIGKFLSGDYDFVQQDIEAVVAKAKPHNITVKVILESCYLSPEEIEKACLIAKAAGANFVKTSTGFGTSGASPEAIEIMVKTVGDTMEVKASGGIRTWQDAVNYLEQGATRLGVGSTEAVLDGENATGEY
jgi:deoxyribose-phosphate aldolase